MSRFDQQNPILGDAASVDAIEQIIVPRLAEVGGLAVDRVLPFRSRRMVGPFVFLDQMGPGEIIAGEGIDVAPHPHINLATVTYLFDGVMRHKDSLGSDMLIRPGAVNLMTAGRGIVHSERSDAELRQSDERLYGVQSWLALPEAVEEMAPTFEHVPTLALPSVEEKDLYARVILGEYEGMKAPVTTFGHPIYVDFRLRPGASVQIPASYEERALYLAWGNFEVAGRSFGPNQMLVLNDQHGVSVRNTGDVSARFLLLGGDRMDGPRHIWWNFVSSRKERIEQAKEEWRHGKFDTVPGDEKDFTPLPEYGG